MYCFQIRLSFKTMDEIRNMTKEERAKWQYEEATKRNELRLRQQIESGEFVPRDKEKEEKKKKL